MLYLLNQVHRFVSKVYYSLFRPDVPRPTFLFGATSVPIFLTAREGVTNPIVHNTVHVVVVEVEFRKMPSAPFHEFLVFKVEGSRSFQNAIIIVDRFVAGTVTDEELWAHAIHADTDEPELKYVASPPAAYRQDTIIDRPASLLGQSPILVHDSPSEGILTFINAPNHFYMKRFRKGSFVCRKFRPWNPTFTVAELLTLSHAVHHQNRSYHLLQHQCYWFADVLYNAAKERCGKVYETILKPRMSPGDFGIVQVIRHRPETHSDVLQRHKEAWVTAEQRIKDIDIYRRACKEAREAMRKVAPLRAEAEARGAEAEAQRAEAEAQRAKARAWRAKDEARWAKARERAEADARRAEEDARRAGEDTRRAWEDALRAWDEGIKALERRDEIDKAYTASWGS
ncbi:hypothetical protein JB92DRAFT_2949521 [Gautieria morchelliformis]|nr:hypothetical protein JB92DRAFT_2949521 [Gautieria morchelliformis]